MFTRILVPTDFSEPSDAALAYAQAIAIRYGSSLHLLHVVDDLAATGMFAAEGYVPDAADAMAAVTRDAEARLAAFLPVRTRPSATTSAVLQGPPAQTICQRATDLGADLIVMGTHGRTGLTHVLLGSVAERVVRNAYCPVLTVHAQPDTVSARVPEWSGAIAMA